MTTLSSYASGLLFGPSHAGTALMGVAQAVPVHPQAPHEGFHLPHGHGDVVSPGLVFAVAGAAACVTVRTMVEQFQFSRRI